MTQPSLTIDTPSRLNRFGAGESFGDAAARLVSASILAGSTSIPAPSGYEPPAHEAGSLMFTGLESNCHGIAKQCRLVSGAWTRSAGGSKQGGEGVEAPLGPITSQSISTRRKLSQCHRL